MKFRCENGHIITRPPTFDKKGARTKCGACQAVVPIKALPEDEQHCWIVHDGAGMSAGSVARQNKSSKRKGLSNRPAISRMR